MPEIIYSLWCEIRSLYVAKWSNKPNPISNDVGKFSLYGIYLMNLIIERLNNGCVFKNTLKIDFYNIKVNSTFLA